MIYKNKIHQECNEIGTILLAREVLVILNFTAPKLVPIIGEYIGEIIDSKKNSACEICKNQKSSCCPYCFAELILQKLRELKANEETIEEFLNSINFNMNTAPKA